jgi:sulfatase modifying factor 1
VSAARPAPCCAQAAPRAGTERHGVATLAREDAGRRARHHLVSVPAGAFLMGGQDPEAVPGDGEGPVREVELNAYRIGATTVTNEQFAAFVETTGHRTDAERFGWSFVFHLRLPEKDRARWAAPRETWWWRAVPGACWHAPEGPGSDVAERSGHPVVHVSWADAAAYCAWAGFRLPTEAEWERAARGGLERARLPWGDELTTPDGRPRAHVWQGDFPVRSTVPGGVPGPVAAGSGAPNGFGLYHASGNVWEWCADWFAATHPPQRPLRNPAGPSVGDRRVIRGGSYLCHDSYCTRYRVAARSANTPDSSSDHTGFRVAAPPR